MPEEIQSPATETTGQTAPAPGMEGTTAAAPVADAGQAGDQGRPTTEPVADTQAVDSFFDPRNLPPELQQAYKQMQSAYTKKTQALAQHRQKIEAYDAFARDPVGSLQHLASQYGMTLTRAQAATAIRENQQAQNNSPDWQPQTWDEVLSKAEERAMAKVMEKLSPLMGNVQQMQAKNIETQLSGIDPNWRIYEDDMRQTLAAHPSLVSDVEKLYRLSVPEEVYSSRAVQAAIQKLQSKTQQASVGRGSTVSRGVPAEAPPKNFAEAVEFAKRSLAQQGR